MFDAGPFELLFLVFIGVIVLGPEKLPAVARTLGNWVRRGRSMAGEFQRELEKEVDLHEVKKLQQEMADVAKPLKDTMDEGNSILNRETQSFKDSMKPDSPNKIDDLSEADSTESLNATGEDIAEAPKNIDQTSS